MWFQKKNYKKKDMMIARILIALVFISVIINIVAIMYLNQLLFHKCNDIDESKQQGQLHNDIEENSTETLKETEILNEEKLPRAYSSKDR